MIKINRNSKRPDFESLEDRTLLTAQVVADINTVSAHSGNPREFVQVGEQAFFVAENELGTEVWRTDGTSEGTRIVRDIVPGPGSSWPGNLVGTNERAFFIANNQLWASDGTNEGTILLEVGEVIGINGSAALIRQSSSLFLSDGTEAGTNAVEFEGLPLRMSLIAPVSAGEDYMIFAAGDLESPTIYRIDTTSGEVTRLLDLPVSNGIDFIENGDTLIVRSVLRETGLTTLWGVPLNDPDSAVVLLVDRQFPDRPDLMEVSGGFFYFSFSKDGQQTEFWRTDGTQNGTVPLLTFPEVRDLTFHEMTAGENGELFFALSTADSGLELWRSDGTPAGTGLLVDSLPGDGDGFPHDLLYHGGKLWFIANNEDGQFLFTSDGTAEGTTPVTESSFSGEQDPRIFGLANEDSIFFLADGGSGAELWISNGSSEGTQPVFDVRIGPNGSQPSGLTSLGNDTFVFAATSVDGRELWRTDGTAAGTSMVADIATGAGTLGSNPNDLLEFNGSLYFTASDGEHGSELWRTDGTDRGTQLVADISPGGRGSSPDSLTVVGNTLYFVADDGIHGRELWQTDGTSAGTMLAIDLIEGPDSGNPSNLVDVAGQLHFVAGVGDVLPLGRIPSLWKLAGEEATQLFVANDGSSNRRLPELRDLTVFGDSLAFFEFDEGNRANPIRFHVASSSGEVTLVRDNITNRLRFPPQMVGVGDRVAFVANDPEAIRDAEIFVYDGTSTTLLTGDVDNLGPTLLSLGDRIYFDTRAGRSYFSDLTPERTLLSTSEDRDRVRSVVVSDNFTYLFMEAFSGERGPVRLLPPGDSARSIDRLATLDPTRPTELVGIGNAAYVVANLPDGSGYGLQATADVAAEDVDFSTEFTAAPGTRPRSLTLFNDRLFFVADDGINGGELWSLPLASESLPGDVNGDGTVNAADIDLVFAAVRGQSTDSAFDLNGDSAIDGADPLHLITEILQTVPGDANLDRRIDVQDFLALSRNFNQQDAGWERGDFNGDGTVGINDFLALSRNFGFSFDDDE